MSKNYVPSSFEECVKRNPKSASLRTYAVLFDILAVIDALIILVTGFVLKDQLRYALKVYDYDVLVIVAIIVLAVVVFLALHYKAVMLRGLAENIQNTHVSKNVALYCAFKNNEVQLSSTVTKQEEVKKEEAVNDDACPKCGAKLDPNAAFCTTCGEKLK